VSPELAAVLVIDRGGNIGSASVTYEVSQ